MTLRPMANPAVDGVGRGQAARRQNDDHARHTGHGLEGEGGGVEGGS
jgi:hypothetical protein